ncbi:DNA polymerase III subunit delta [Aquilutibacter rugosus]|uniref:DNA polymerase III subunit delta n=1 Tax=Aquilutibacter rugosus TaxID=3115820 RepID=UPI002F4222EF
MEMPPDKLVAQLAANPPASLYLIAGPEALLVIEAADAVRKAARQAGSTERVIFEVTTADTNKAKDTNSVWSEIEAALNAPSLFSPCRLIEIRLPTGRPGTEGGKFLERIAKQPPRGDIVMVLADEWSKRHEGNWTRAFEANGVVSVAWAKKPGDLPAWLGQRLRSRGLQLDPDAIRVIADRVDGNLLAAAQEVDKLCLLLGTTGTTLNAEQIRALVADLARFDVFRLLEAAWNGQGAQTLRMLEGLRQEGEVIPALMGMVIIELKITAALSAAAGSGSLDRAFSERRVWPAKQAMYRRALERHGYRRWQRFLVEAGKVDRASKGREVGDAWVHLQRLLVAIAAPGGIGLLRSEIAAA